MVPDRETCSETNAFAAVTFVKVARTPLPQSSVSSDVLMRAGTLRTLGNLAADNANTQPMWARTGQLPLLPAHVDADRSEKVFRAYKERRRSALTPPNLSMSQSMSICAFS